MVQKTREITSAKRSLIAISIAISTLFFLRPSAANAQPVSYVKVCTLYGGSFLYVPGTDTCLNVELDDARNETTTGTWRNIEPVSRWQWIKSQPKRACRGGTLVKVGDFTGSDFVAPNNRLQAKTPFPLNLNTNQYVKSVFFSGGLFATLFDQVALLPACPSPNTSVGDANDVNCTAGAPAFGGGSTVCEVACSNGAWVYTGDVGGTISSNFCLYYDYPDAQTYQAPVPLGCVNTRTMANLAGTIQFTATSPVPRTDLGPVYLLLANGMRSVREGQSTSVIQGQLSVWVCLGK